MDSSIDIEKVTNNIISRVGVRQVYGQYEVGLRLDVKVHLGYMTLYRY